MPMINEYISTHDQILNLSKHQNNSGKLKIAAPESLVTTGLSDFIKYFLEKYPNTDIDLYNNTCNYNQTLLMEGDVDGYFSKKYFIKSLNPVVTRDSGAAIFNF